MAWVSIGIITSITLLSVLMYSVNAGSKPLSPPCYHVDIDVVYNSSKFFGINMPELKRKFRASVLTMFVTKTWPERHERVCGEIKVEYHDVTLESLTPKPLLAATFSYKFKDERNRTEADAKLIACINSSLVNHDTYVEKFNLLSSIPSLNDAHGNSTIKAVQAAYGTHIRYCCLENLRKTCCSNNATFNKETNYCECNPGHYYEPSQPSVCSPCSRGTYQPKADTTQCLLCPEGSTTVADGATYCAEISECKGQEDWKIQGVFLWKNAQVGTRAKHACPYGPANVSVIRECHRHPVYGAFWGELDASICNKSKRTSTLLRLSQVPVDKSNVLEVSKGLVTATKEAMELSAFDVALATESLSNIVEIKDSLVQVCDEVLNVLSNILQVDGKTLYDSLRHNQTTSRILNITEKFAENIPLLENGSLSLAAPNIALSVEMTTSEMLQDGFTFQINPSKDGNITSKQSSPLANTSMTVGYKAFQAVAQRGSRRLISVVYRNNKLFPVINGKNVLDKGGEMFNGTGDKYRVGSIVLAGKFKGASITGVEDAVQLTFVKDEEGKIKENPHCVYWDFRENDGFGNWSSEGCQYVDTKLGAVTCRCNHMTNFALLLTADTERSEFDETHRTALTVISYIGCGVSLLGCFLTFLTYTLFRCLRRNNAQLILCHLCISLIALLVLFLVAATRRSDTTTCRVVSVMVHYFLLTTFAWMAVEGINMYLAFVKVMSAHVPRFMPKAMAFSWGVPVVIVSVTGSLAFNDYSTENSCFIHGLVFYVSVFAPVLTILVGNLILFGLTMYSLSQMGKEVSQENKFQGYQRVKVALAIMVLLGLTWLFGAIAIGSVRLVFQYVFCVFNSLQGFAIFWFHCVRQREVRECWMEFICTRGSRKRRYTTSTMVPAYKRSTAATPNLPTSGQHEKSDGNRTVDNVDQSEDRV